MTDDIETLREFIEHAMRKHYGDSSFSKNAIAALERVEMELREYDGTILHLEAITKSLVSTEAERDSLRAKNERAKEALGSAPTLSKYHGTHGFDREAFISHYEKWKSDARAVLAELSADAS